MSRSVAAARFTRAAASPLQQSAEATAAASPEGLTPRIPRKRNLLRYGTFRSYFAVH